MTNSHPRLSYLIVTKNKLKYFQQGLEKLITNKLPDEEIIVGDGNSTDGTKEYLEKMKSEGKINDYISEPDYCESHALNKLFLKARGDIIKIINDDDAYYYPVINACKEYMLENTDIDFMGMEGGSFKNQTAGKQTLLQVKGYVENFNKWKTSHTPFEFAVLGLMFRRTSLPLLGFWDLSFKNADAEYTFRATASKATMAWCLNPAFVFIRTIEGVTMNNLQRMKNETIRLRKFYLNENPTSKILSFVRNVIKNIIRKFTSKQSPFVAADNSWSALYKEAEKWLIDNNKNRKVEIIK